MKQTVKTGALIAAAAAAMALSGAASAATGTSTADDSVHCYLTTLYAVPAYIDTG